MFITSQLLFAQDAAIADTSPIATKIEFHKLVVQRGQTFSGLLTRLGMSYHDIFTLARICRPYFDINKLKPGQILYYNYNNTNRLEELRIVLNTKQELHYLVQENRAVLAGKVVVKVPSILDTTYAQFIHHYPHLKKLLDQLFFFKVGSLDDTDHLLAYTEKYEDEYGTLIKYDPPSYIALSKGDQLYQSYLFNDSYLDNEGQSFTQHDMIKPIDDTIPIRISGNYGWRSHPVTRKKEFHPAVDIAIPAGTPILSIDDGIITKMEHNYWLGTMLTVRHNNGLSSLYGHLSAYAPNVELGSQVSKGQILALSGNTGVTTGAHLHFGLIYHDKPLSPLLLWQPQTLAIANDEDKTRFEAIKQHIETELAHYKDTVNHDDQVLNNVQG